MWDSAIRSIARALGGAAILITTATALPAQTVELSGVWEDGAGNVYRIEHRGNAVVVTALQVTGGTATTFGFVAGDTALRGTLNGKTLKAQIHLRFPIQPWRAKCPTQWDFWRDIDLTVEDSANTLQGGYTNRDIKGDECKITDAEQITWYVFRQAFLSEPIVKGFRDDTSAKPKVVRPQLPRFFVNREGHMSVDLAPGFLAGATQILAEFMQPDPQYTATIRPASLRPNPVSDGRWVTIDLHQKLVELGGIKSNDLYGQRDFSFRVRARNGAGPWREFVSPPVDRYRMLEFMRQRCEWLARLLFEFPLEFANNMTPEERERRAWGVFVRSWKPELSVIVRHRGYERTLDEPVFVYALLEDANGQETWQRIDTQHVAVTPRGESVVKFPVNADSLWEDDKIETFRGLQMIVGSDTAAKLRAKATDGSSLRTMFRMSPADPRKIAALLIATYLGQDGVGAKDTVGAAKAYLGVEIPDSTGLVYSRRRSAQRTAQAWADMIAEFEALTALKKSAFASAPIGALHNLMEDNKDGTTVHIGFPTEGGPGMYAAGSRPGERLHERFELEIPNSEIFMRGVMAAFTNGVAAGDVPMSEEGARRRLNGPEERNAGDQARGWRTPIGYSDEYTKLSPEDLEAFAQSLNSSQMLNQVKGDLAEGLAAREMAAPRVERLRAQGRRPLFIPGWKLRNYTMNWTTHELEGPGTKMMDGLVVTGTNIASVNGELEVKSGTAGVAGMRDQLLNHETTAKRDGVAVIFPSAEELAYFQRMGVGSTTKVINGKDTPVLYIPKEKLQFSTTEDRFMMGTAEDIVAPNGQRLSIPRQAIEDLAADAMLREGLHPTRWDDPRLGLEGYLDYYNHLVPASAQQPRGEVIQQYLRGNRVNPDNGEWEPIFVGALANDNPFMGEEEFISRYRNTVSSPTNEQISTARQKFRTGWRIDPESHWNKPEFIVDPNERDVMPEEQFELWKQNVPNSGMSDDDARARIANGQVFDLESRRWKNKQPSAMVWDAAAQMDRWAHATGGDPASEAGKAAREQIGEGKVWNTRRGDWVARPAEPNDLPAGTPGWYKGFRSEEGANAAQLVLDMINTGLLESGRVGRQRLLVIVRQKDNSQHIFVGVRRGEVGPSGEVEEWHDVGSGAVQKWILMQWYRASQGFWTEAGVPQWLADAHPDGEAWSW